MASIEKITKKDGTHSYRVFIRKKGFKDKSETFDSEEKAKKWAEETENSLDLFTAEIPTFTINDMFDRYTIETLPKKSRGQKSDEEHHISFWRQHLNTQMLVDITPHEIERVADLLYSKTSFKTGKGLSTESRRKYLMTLSYIFGVASKYWKWVSHNPVYQVDKHIDRFREEKAEKVADTEIIKDLKRSLASQIRRIIGKDSEQATCRKYGVPKTSLQNILSEKQNVSLMQLCSVVNKMGLDVDIIIKDKIKLG